MKTKKDKSIKASVVYNKNSKQNYIDKLDRSREIRIINVGHVKKSILDLVSEIESVEHKVNEQAVALNNINSGFNKQSYLKFKWQSQKNIAGVYGPYWDITEYKDNIKTTKAYVRDTDVKNVSEDTLRTPTSRDIDRIYRYDSSEVKAIRNIVVTCRRKRKKLIAKLISIYQSIKKMDIDLEAFPFIKVKYRYDKDMDIQANGKEYRKVNLEFMMNVIDIILDEVITDEFYIDKHILSANILTPKRYMGIGISWTLYSSGKYRKEKVLPPFGPLRPQWYLVNRWTPNTHGKGRRQLKNIPKLTKDIIYKAQQGKIQRELLQLSMKIGNLEKHRIKRIRILRSIWKRFVQSYKRNMS